MLSLSSFISATILETLALKCKLPAIYRAADLISIHIPPKDLRHQYLLNSTHLLSEVPVLSDLVKNLYNYYYDMFFAALGYVSTFYISP